MRRKFFPLKHLMLLLAPVALMLLCRPWRLHALIFWPDRQLVQRLNFPVADSPFPVAAGDTVADHVLGQMDFAHGTLNFATASTLDLQRSQAGIAIDRSSVPNHIYVADAANSRVLVWLSVTALTNGKAADAVIGQPDFFSTACNNGGLSASSLCAPSGVAVDSSGNLYVSDTGNSRVLEYNTPLVSTGQPGSGDKIADQVFGQAGNFTTGQCNQGAQNLANSGTLCRPGGIAIDSAGVLYIADTGNNRALEYLFPSIDVIPDDVFGQGGQFTTTQCNKGARSADSLCSPGGMVTDSLNNLYIADTGNSRVLEYDNPVANDTTADRIFGQSGNFSAGSCNEGGSPNFFTLCGADGAALDTADRLYIADRGNSRVLFFPTPLSNSIPSNVFGQGGSLTTGTCNFHGVPDSQSMCAPTGVAVDILGNLYVGDASNNRVLKFNSAASSDTTADVVLGQPDFTHNDRNAVDASTFAGSGADVILAGTLDISALGALAIDHSVSPPRIYVADTHNNRVLRFDNLNSLANGAAASVVIGESSFTTGFSRACSGTPTASNLCSPTAVAVDASGNLFVADEQDNRVLKFAAPVTTGKAASLVIGQPGFSSKKCNGGGAPSASVLCSPWSLALDGSGNLYVADLTNNRVLEYTKPTTSNPSAARVFGQVNFTSGSCNQAGTPSASTLCEPTYVTLDAGGRLYIADFNNSRVLRYNTPLTSKVANAEWGQGSSGNDFTDSNCNLSGIGPASLCNPAGAAADGAGNVYIADSGNNRILHYAPGSFKADLVFGQGGFFITNKPNLGGTAPSAATLSLPLWLALDSAGNLYASDAQNNRVLQYLAPLGAPSPTPTPGNANLSAAGLMFGNVAPGSVSKSQTVTLTNAGAGAITINAVKRAGSNPTDFPFNNGCFGTLGAGKSCSITIMFAPAAAVGTPEAAQFQIIDTARNSPQLLPVYGTSAAQATLSPSSLGFGNVALGSTSASKNLTLSNNQSVALNISGIAIGGANASDFVKVTTCGASLAAFASCTISVQFKPAAAETLGAKSASIAVTDNANNSPQTASLSGSAAVPVTVAPTSLSFGNQATGTTSASQSATITNNQSATLSIGSIALSGANPGDFLKTTTCGSTLAPFASCGVSVSFKPAASGARSAVLSITDSPDSGSPEKVNLSGSGT